MRRRTLTTTLAALAATAFTVGVGAPALAHEHISQDEFEQAARDGKLKETGLKQLGR